MKCEPSTGRHDQDLAVGGAIGDRETLAGKLLLCDGAEAIGELFRLDTVGSPDVDVGETRAHQESGRATLHPVA
jgi:hypothetical protein